MPLSKIDAPSSYDTDHRSMSVHPNHHHLSSAVEEKPGSAGSRGSKKDKEADLVEVKASGYSKK